MSERCGQPILYNCGVEFKQQAAPCIQDMETSVPTQHLPQHANTTCMTLPIGRHREKKWWSIHRAAYGDAFNTTGIRGCSRPFILPAIRRDGDLDAETQRSIQHFNAVLYQFYSDELLPLFYAHAGRMHSFHNKARPIFVNAKQYHCILRRRIQRAKLLKHTQGMPARKKYLHESRHKHATKRLRNAHGRFVSKAKVEEGTTDTTNSSEPSTETDAYAATVTTAADSADQQPELP